MKILNTEIEFNFYDAEQMERLEKYADVASKELNSININEMKQSEIIKKVCGIIENCFDNIFGKGISAKIFKNEKDFRLCLKAFKDFKKARMEQDKIIEQEIVELYSEIQYATEQYSPDRATRRAKK